MSQTFTCKTKGCTKSVIYRPESIPVSFNVNLPKVLSSRVFKTKYLSPHLAIVTQRNTLPRYTSKFNKAYGKPFLSPGKIKRKIIDSIPTDYKGYQDSYPTEVEVKPINSVRMANSRSSKIILSKGLVFEQDHIKGNKTVYLTCSSGHINPYSVKS